MMKKRSAFTIAEIVIAMLVLGGIAMVLMPVLVRDTTQKFNETALNKTYSMFQQTARSIGLLASQGKITPSAGDDADTFFQALSATSKVIKTSKNVGYFDNYQPEVGRNFIFQADNTNTLVLKSGVFVSYHSDGGDNYIVVDTNGVRKPNKVGDDIFYFIVKSDNNSYSVHPALGNCDRTSDDYRDRIGCARRALQLTR